MSNIRKKSLSRVARRHRERQVRRLGLEALERRDCPAVMFEFGGGVLSITGDEGPNVIEIVQRPDGTVSVLGDGERRTFDGVDRIFARTGDGDDQFSGKIILWVRDARHSDTVPFILDLDTGAGNDTIRIDDNRGDGEPARRRNLLTTHSMDLKVDLGSGVDEFFMQLDDHKQVDLDLDLTAEDGNEKILIGMLLPAIQKVREAAARIEMNLGGGDNEVSIHVDGFDQVELDLSAVDGGNTIQFAGDDGYRDVYMDEFFPPWCVIDWDFGGGGNLVGVNTNGFDEIDLDVRAAGGNNVVKHEALHRHGLRHEHIRPESIASASLALAGDGNQVAVNTRGYDAVDLDLDLAGNNNQVAIALLLPAVQKVREAAARVEMDFGGGDNAVDVLFENIDDVDLSIVSPPPTHAAGGTIPVYWHAVTSGTSYNRGDGVVLLYSSLPGGSAAREAGGVSPISLSVTATAGGTNSPPSVNVELNLGPSDDTVSVTTDGVPKVNLDVDTGDGDDAVEVRSNVFAIWPTTGFISNINLGSGDDKLEVDAYYGRGILKSTDSGSTWNVDLGEGDDLADIKTHGFTDVSLDLTAGAGDDSVKFKPLFAFRVEDLDGPTQLDISADLGDGDDRLEIDAAGYGNVHSFIDAGAGHDRAGTRLFVGNLSFTNHHTQINAVTLLGAGNDRLVLETSGYGQADILVDAGDGDDKVHVRHRMFAIVDRTQLNVVVLLGAGSDSLMLETFGNREVRTKFDTGPAGDGRDSIFARHDSLRRSGRRDVRRVVLDGGMDVYEHIALGYAVQALTQSLTSTEYVFVAESAFGPL